MTIAVPRVSFERGAGLFDSAWQRHAALLAGTCVALLLLFRADVADLAAIYWTNTTFGHCLFIAPVVAWLVWQRRRELALVPPVGWWPGLVVMSGGGFAWLIGDAAGVALFRHLGLVVMLQGAAVALLGPNVTRALLFPLAYMIFLVPFGESLEGPLQDLTVRILVPLLHLFAVPAQVDGVLITTPNGWFEVAEACSGAKFVIAMIAYGALVANVCYVSWRRRAAFMAVALIVPMVANGLRAFGTVYAAYLTSVEQATGYDHIVYGWVFFGLVMAGVMAIGWKWFDRDPDAPWFDAAKLQAHWPGTAQLPAVVALTGLFIVSLFLAWAGAIAARADTLPARIALPQVAGWQQVPLSARATWKPNFPGADHFLMGRYSDGMGAQVDLVLAVYGSQREGKELVGFGQGAIRENDKWVRIEDLPALDGGKALRMTAGPVEREVVTWYRVGDVLTGSDGRVKAETLKAKLLRGRQRAVAVLVSAEKDAALPTRAAIKRFMAAVGPVERVADAAAGGDRPPDVR
ncbi:exosortase A [Sphingomonas turrisvirgatae]|uniref:Exosortase n=1 Tax=Sphingomonas turrisvirgatae TaxID=1888892 RepID=A0A1E3LSS4_9SPHN|nr:exosortase A [Sphingomonas turrisvirgatae]ODP36836.1 exosortase [Sphingomonas turrisvirgatae]